MKIALLSDIHANYAALQTVSRDVESWQPDCVVVAGDLVTRGPRPLDCLRFIEEKYNQQNWLMVRGNHEDYILHQAMPNTPRSGPAFETHRASYWAYQQIGGDVSFLEAMPFQQSITSPRSGEIRFVHASMVSNRDGVYPFTTDAQLANLIGPPPVVLGVGHTHFPLIRSLNRTLVVNAGAVGLPFDGDPRASYGRITQTNKGWQAEIIRISYDIQEAERDFQESGYLENAGPLAELVRLELLTAHPLLGGWANAYQELALAGKISMQQSVARFLKH